MASSIFGKDPSKEPAPPAFARERIEQEIAHLKKPQSTRHGASTGKKASLGTTIFLSLLVIILGLYFMDPIFYSWYKGDAINAYLYLHNYGGDQKAQALAVSGILSQEEIQILNRRQGSFQDYYATPQDAEKMADTIVNFMNGLRKLRKGPYADLSPLNKIRYTLFCRWGFFPPAEWTALNPVVKDE